MKMHLVTFAGLAARFAITGICQLATAATLCVSPGGTSGCYSTIGAAVLRAQMDYIDNGTIDKIDVAAGVYMEAVKIETPVFLVGAGHGRSIINALGLANGIYIDGIDSPKPRLSQLLRRRKDLTAAKEFISAASITPLCVTTFQRRTRVGFC